MQSPAKQPNYQMINLSLSFISPFTFPSLFSCLFSLFLSLHFKDVSIIPAVRFPRIPTDGCKLLHSDPHPLLPPPAAAPSSPFALPLRLHVGWRCVTEPSCTLVLSPIDSRSGSNSCSPANFLAESLLAPSGYRLPAASQVGILVTRMYYET